MKRCILSGLICYGWWFTWCTCTGILALSSQSKLLSSEYSLAETSVRALKYTLDQKGTSYSASFAPEHWSRIWCKVSYCSIDQSSTRKLTTTSLPLYTTASKLLIDRDWPNTFFCTRSTQLPWLTTVFLTMVVLHVARCHIYFKPNLPMMVLDVGFESKTPRMLFHTTPGSWLASMPDQIPVFL